MALWLFLIAGLCAQLIDGSLGMGFGVISSTILVGLGVAPAMASASVHTAEIATTLASGTSHFRFGNVKKEWLLPLVVPGIVGGTLGAAFLSSIPGGAIKPYVAGFLLIMGLVMIYRFTLHKVKIAPSGKVSYKKMVGLGFIAAFFDAMGGGGWGPIATPGLVLTENEEPRKVIGTVNIAEFFVTIAEAVTFFLILGSKSYNWGSIGMIALGGVCMAPVAAWLTKKMPSRVLGLVAGIMVVLYNIRTLLVWAGWI
ncbi:MAG: sulfite exporter TauE/SafE family protein [Dehalococcoidia bacterium]|nr:sulfite exporter TauE/SafE family protein [Dehalococcoidia bacterium]